MNTSPYYLRLYDNKSVYFFSETYTQIANGNVGGSSFINMKYKLLSLNDTINNLGSMFSYKDTKSYNYIDNVFEYSFNKLANDNLFNWTENTAVYTGVKAMTDNLQINITVIPMIITYWFLLTVIYVLIDLVIKAFTVLTHMIIKKT